MTDVDLRKRAREKATLRLRATRFPTDSALGREMARAITIGYVEGYLAHAAQQPSREGIAKAIHAQGGITEDLTPERCSVCRQALATADAVLRLLDGDENA